MSATQSPRSTVAVPIWTGFGIGALAGYLRCRNRLQAARAEGLFSGRQLIQRPNAGFRTPFLDEGYGAFASRSTVLGRKGGVWPSLIASTCSL
jgi:hypothetical protein